MSILNLYQNFYEHHSFLPTFLKCPIKSKCLHAFLYTFLKTLVSYMYNLQTYLSTFFKLTVKMPTWIPPTLKNLIKMHVWYHIFHKFQLKHILYTTFFKNHRFNDFAWLWKLELLKGKIGGSYEKSKIQRFCLVIIMRRNISIIRSEIKDNIYFFICMIWRATMSISSFEFNFLSISASQFDFLTFHTWIFLGPYMFMEYISWEFYLFMFTILFIKIWGNISLFSFITRFDKLEHSHMVAFITIMHFRGFHLNVD